MCERKSACGVMGVHVGNNVPLFGCLWRWVWLCLLVRLFNVMLIIRSIVQCVDCAGLRLCLYSIRAVNSKCLAYLLASLVFVR